MSQFFEVRKSALELKPCFPLIILSVELARAREKFGTVSQACFPLKAAKKEKRKRFEKIYLVCEAWGKFGTVSQFLN